MSLIGMTTSPEAFLAREAEICYAAMAHVTDYDVWHVSQAPVTVDQVIKTLNQNTEVAQRAIRQLLLGFNKERICDCGNALVGAIIAQRGSIPRAIRKKLAPLIEHRL
jgi:5'-methylthioadenosine phosphorylase